jgi:two-component system nitrogen regulation response regulator GlnG
VHGFAPDALERLVSYRWPGNVRQLEAVIRQSLLNTIGSVVLLEFLPNTVFVEVEGTAAPDSVSESDSYDLESFLTSRLRDDSTDDLYVEAIAMMERHLLARVLQHTDGNQSQAAKILGITRSTLRNRIRSLHISLGATVSAHDESVEFDGD